VSRFTHPEVVPDLYDLRTYKGVWGGCFGDCTAKILCKP